ncbi:MAG: UDP-N-acetylmuramoyl-tripeptide--D-alanyl-D-alanine ligase [Candidatus Howiella sp.]|jgi:UDP-N-acetylmuramoyl-tripeptide--D-alanyl-D-alanine ligase
MGVLLNLSAAAIIVATLFALTRQLHMLQLNSYYPSRYFGWLKGAFRLRSLCAGLFALLLAIGFFFGWNGWTLLPLCLVGGGVRAAAAVYDYRHSIKKIVFTARVKRLYATATALLCLLLLAANFFPRTGILILLFLSAATPLLALAAWAVNAPVERAVQRHYIRDAKRILQSHPGLTVIGVTGSYGKTSTKHAVGRLLSEKYNVLITPGSFNTPMGVVRTVREQLRPTTQVFVVEMGAKNVGDIREICEIADPDIAIVTSVGPQHLDTFGSVENVLRTKLELANWVSAKGGPVFLNTENAYLRERLADYPTAVSYGQAASADFHAENIVYSPHGSAFDFVGAGRRIPVSSRMLGGHNVLNITAAAAVGVRLGLRDLQIKAAVRTLNPVSHRLELKQFIGGSVLIDDAYNANPEGCLEAVRVLSHFDGMKKIIVTPGLVELGDREYDCNFALGRAAAKVCDIILLVGEKRAVPMADAVRQSDFDQSNLHIVHSFQEAMERMRGFVKADCVVLFENDLPDNYAG